jgi:putative addiction module component (TIGR02574 family)
LDCGGKRSATPLSERTKHHAKSTGLRTSESAAPLRSAGAVQNAAELELGQRQDYNSPMSAATIQNELLNLPASERARLLELLWNSLSDPEIQTRETTWAEESERRINAYDAGELKARAAADVFNELEKKLRQ